MKQHGFPDGISKVKIGEVLMSLFKEKNGACSVGTTSLDVI